MQLDELELILDPEIRKEKTRTPAFRKKPASIDEEPLPSAAKIRLKRKELRLFASTCSRLLRGGVPILRALEASQREFKNGPYVSMLKLLAEKIRQGASLSQALEAPPAAFPIYFSKMVKAGEMSGTLEQILERLARHLAKEEEMRRKIREALAYPALVLSLGITTLFVLLEWVIPKMTSVYESFGSRLPFLTRAVLLASKLFLPAVCLALFLLMLTAFLLRKHKDLISSWFLKLPVAGELYRHILLSQFCSLLSLELASGIPILQALDSVKDTFSNALFQRDLGQVRESLAQGQRLAEAMQGLSWVKESSLALIYSGEEAGKLPEALAEEAQDSEQELESRAQVLVKLLEPGMILGVGLVVGIIVIAALLPILELDMLAR